MTDAPKPPENCASLQEIRTEIDRIDQQVIQLLGDRFQYVKAAAQFKNDETSVRAPERFAAMLVHRRQWAEAAELNPEVVESLYRDLVNYFIDEERRHWQNHS
ncbi:MAG: isochorismate lyase [Cyanobacteria bacterium P01_H01_bin.119]